MWKYIVTFILILIGFIVIKSFDIYNRYKYHFIKLDKTNIKLKENLLKKYDLLIKQIKIFKKKKKLNEKDYSDFIDTDINEYDVFSLDNKISKYQKKLDSILQDNEKMITEKEIKKNVNDIERLDITIKSLKKYYNNSIDNYHKYLHKFPSKYIGKIYKYKEKEKYIEE